MAMVLPTGAAPARAAVTAVSVVTAGACAKEEPMRLGIAHRVDGDGSRLASMITPVPRGMGRSRRGRITGENHFSATLPVGALPA